MKGMAIRFPLVNRDVYILHPVYILYPVIMNGHLNIQNVYLTVGRNDQEATTHEKILEAMKYLTMKMGTFLEGIKK
jgi:hypothetical protein